MNAFVVEEEMHCFHRHLLPLAKGIHELAEWCRHLELEEDYVTSLRGDLEIDCLVRVRGANFHIDDIAIFHLIISWRLSG